jgi:hypothetical protein
MFEHWPRLSCCRGIRETSRLSNDSRGEPYFLQKHDGILGCRDPWVQPVVKHFWQLRILDKMECEKSWSQQLLQLDVVCGREHLRVRTEGLEDCLAAATLSGVLVPRKSSSITNTPRPSRSALFTKDSIRSSSAKK